MYLSKEIVTSELDVISDLSTVLPELVIQSGTSTTALDKLLEVAGRASLRAKPTPKGTRVSARDLDLDEETPNEEIEAVTLDDTFEAIAGDEFYTRPNGEKYYARNWGGHTDVEVLRKARENSAYVLLYGNPGTGKTACVEASFPEELYTILGSGDTEVSDLVGSYVQTPSGDFEWVDGVLVKSAEEGKVLLIDEIGLIDPKVLSVVYGLMDGRKELVVTANPERGTVKAKEGFYVIAATNPNAPGVRLSEALLSRFSIQAEMTTDWARAKAMGVMSSAVVASQNLAKKFENGETSWSPQMRELLDFQRNADLFGQKWAIQNLLASSPEIDRAIVADVFSRVFGEQVLPARI